MVCYSEMCSINVFIKLYYVKADEQRCVCVCVYACVHACEIYLFCLGRPAKFEI